MPRVLWPLLHDCPSIEIVLTQTPGGKSVVRRLLADTGAGSAQNRVQLLLPESDCVSCGGNPIFLIDLHGAYKGLFIGYELRVRLPALGFDQMVPVAGVPAGPTGFDGIACFRFL